MNILRSYILINALILLKFSSVTLMFLWLIIVISPFLPEIIRNGPLSDCRNNLHFPNSFSLKVPFLDPPKLKPLVLKVILGILSDSSTPLMSVFLSSNPYMPVNRILSLLIIVFVGTEPQTSNPKTKVIVIPKMKQIRCGCFFLLWSNFWP